MSPDELEAALLRAHEEEDVASLIRLYTQAAHRTEDQSARRFFLTQAYVFALETGAAEASALRQDLISLGGER